MGMFDRFPGSSRNRREFAPGRDCLRIEPGLACPQAMAVPFSGFASAEVMYYQQSRASLSLGPGRVSSSPCGGGSMLSWSLTPDETAAFGGSLVGVLVQARLRYEDGSERASKPQPVAVMETLWSLAGSDDGGGSDGE